MTRTTLLVAGALLIATPTFAQTSGAGGRTATTPPSTSRGNGVTTGTTSSPVMKTGAERSPTAGAPTYSMGIGGSAGGAPSRN